MFGINVYFDWVPGNIVPLGGNMTTSNWMWCSLREQTVNSPGYHLDECRCNALVPVDFGTCTSDTWASVRGDACSLLLLQSVPNFWFLWMALSQVAHIGTQPGNILHWLRACPFWIPRGGRTENFSTTPIHFAFNFFHKHFFGFHYPHRDSISDGKALNFMVSLIQVLP